MDEREIERLRSLGMTEDGIRQEAQRRAREQLGKTRPTVSGGDRKQGMNERVCSDCGGPLTHGEALRMEGLCKACLEKRWADQGTLPPVPLESAVARETAKLIGDATKAFRDTTKGDPEQAWRQFASEVGGRFSKGGSRSVRESLLGAESRRVMASVKRWTMTLDTCTESLGPAGTTTSTRMRASYVKNDQLQLQIGRREKKKGPLANLLGLWGWLGVPLLLPFLPFIIWARISEARSGMRDIEVGYPDFEREFWVRGNDESKVRA